MSKYHTELDTNNANTSHAHLLDLVGYNKRVLDVGCATGYLARELVSRGCTVSGVEYDADAAEQARPVLDRVMVADLETADLVAEFGREQFDAVVFGDVLEHLRDPLAVLRRARPLLAQGGCVVISVPNVSHGAVRLALLAGRWEYRALGLLDDTHLRFFTRPSLKRMLRSAGLVAVEIRGTYAGVFETELEVKPEDYDPAVVDEVLQDPDATVYQFVLKAVPDDAGQAVQDLQDREEQHLLRIDELTAETARLQSDVDALRDRVAELESAPPPAPPPPPPPPPRSRGSRLVRGVGKAIVDALR